MQSLIKVANYLIRFLKHKLPEFHNSLAVNPLIRFLKHKFPEFYYSVLPLNSNSNVYSNGDDKRNFSPKFF